MDNMQDGFIDINNVPTKIICFGRWINDKATDKEDKIILLIPGNPGILEFYLDFMKILHEKFKCPVWSISHSGHQRPNEKSKAFKKPLGLRQQIDLKIAFIEQYITPDTELHIISHSIGSYMTLKLFKNPNVENRISHAYLLFPTIERMLEAPNAKPLAYSKPFIPLFCFLAWVLSFVPKVIVLKMIQLYMLFASIPNRFVEIIYPLIDPNIIRDVFFLAFEEIDQVRERDDETLRKHCNKISILYGEKDDWCCKEFYDNMRNDFKDIRVKKEPYQHAFIFRESEQVAEIIIDWMDLVKNKAAVV